MENFWGFLGFSFQNTLENSTNFPKISTPLLDTSLALAIQLIYLFEFFRCSSESLYFHWHASKWKTIKKNWSKEFPSDSNQFNSQENKIDLPRLFFFFIIVSSVLFSLSLVHCCESGWWNVWKLLKLFKSIVLVKNVWYLIKKILILLKNFDFIQKSLVLFKKFLVLLRKL